MWCNILVLVFWALLYWTTSKAIVSPLRDAPSGGKIQEKLLSNGMIIMRKRVSFEDALSLCEDKQLRLAILSKLDDARALVAAIEAVSKSWISPKHELRIEFGMSRRYWIGLTDVGSEGEWVWALEGSILGYSGMWAYGQPEHLRSKTRNHTEHCVTLWNQNFDEKNGTHLFNDENCMNKHYFICSKPR